MVFVADDLGAWLVGLLADAGRKKLTTLVLGTDQERALRSAATAAVQLTANDLRPHDAEQAEHVALVISQVFDGPVPVAWLAGHATVLEALHAGIAGQLAVLDDASLTGTGKSSAEVLGVPGKLLAENLAGHLLREIVTRGARGGPLEPLANQLNHDRTYLQGERVEGKVDQLDDRILEVLVRLDSVPARRRRLESAYWAMVREVHSRTPQLLGRVTELAELSAFFTGLEGYRWLVGGAWAGKTALVAEAITTTLLPEVDVVAYFLSRREGDADSSHFLAAVVPQLADLLGEDPPVPDLYGFRGLWDRATKHAASAGRHLLLVVDGLDEDLRPSGSPSVAALLPTNVCSHVHVLVSSRPHPELPADVPDGHPLTKTRPMPLEPSKAALHLSTLARQEIHDLLRRGKDDLAADMLGLLAAAAGALTVSDLAALTGDLTSTSAARFRLIHRLVTEEAARSLQPVGPPEAPRYMFAHESLLEYAQTDVRLQHASYRERIHRWAKHWQNAGWLRRSAVQDATPRYLLDAYPATLGSDPPRLTTLVSDVGWVAAAIQTVGVDSVLAHLRTAQSAAPAHEGVSAMYATLRGQARHLRPPQPVTQLSYVLRQLSLQAAEFADEHLAGSARRRLQALPDAGPVPMWTTRRVSRALSAELGAHHHHIVTALAVLPDGRVVSGGMGKDTRVWIWDPATPGAAPLELGRQESMVNALAVLPDGRVISLGHRWLWVWDPAAVGAAPLKLRRKELAAVAVLRDRMVTGGFNGRVQISDPATPGAAPLELGRHHGYVLALAVLPDGRVVSGGTDGRVRVWDPATPGAAPLELGRPGRWVDALAVLPDGRVVSSGTNRQVCVWDPATPGAAPVNLGRHGDRVQALAVLPDGRVVSGGDDHRVRIWNPATPGAAPLELGHHDSRVLAIVVLPHGRVVSGGNDRSLRLWDPAEAAAAHLKVGRHDRAQTAAAAVLPDGRIVTGGRDGFLRVRNPAAGARPLRFGRHHVEVLALAVLPDGRVVSSGVDRRLRVWDPDAVGATPIELSSDSAMDFAVAALPDGRVISGDGDGWLRVWDPAAPGAPPLKLRCHEGILNSVAVLPDGRVVTSGHDHRLQVSDLAVAGAATIEFSNHDNYANVAALPDGRVVTANDDGWVRVWDPAAPDAPPLEVGRHDDRVDDIVVLPDGRVVSGSSDGQVRVWDVALRIELSRISCSVTAFAAGLCSTVGDCQLVIAHKGGGISAWLIRASASEQ